MKDYMGRQLDLGKEDEYVEINCSKCGDTICYSTEDTSLNHSLCTDCFDKIFPS